MAHYFQGEDDAKSVDSLASTAPSTAPSFLAPRNWPNASVSKAEAEHHRALAIRKAQNAGGKGGKGKGKGKVEHWRTEMQVFKDEVDDKYRARGILLGKGGENLRHISEQTGLRIILEGEVPNAMQLVVVGPMPHVPALKKMRDLVEYVNDDYKQWATRKPARHAHQQESEAASKKATDEAAAKKAAEDVAAKKAAEEAAAAATKRAAAKKAADEAAAAKRAAEKAEAKQAAEEAAAKKAAEESAAAKRAAENAEAKKVAEEAAKKVAEEAAAKKAADEAAAAKRAAEKAEAKKATEEAAEAMPASPVWSSSELKLKDIIAIIREHLDFEDSCNTPAKIIAEANRQLGVQATGTIFQQARTLHSQLSEPW